MRRDIATKASAMLVGLALSTAPVAAQSNRTQDGIGALGNLFGALAQAGAKSKAQKGWVQVGEQVRACVNTTLSSKNITVDQLIAAGIAPGDQRVAPLVTSCNQIMSAQLQTNIPCNVTNSKGQTVASTCNQVFAKEANGQIFEVSRDDFLRAAGSGEKVQIAILETSVANAARLNEERRQAEAERQAFLASPEGKKQAAADAARRQEAERASKQAQAAAAARARQAEVAEAARMKILGAARKSCDAAMDIRHKGNARWSFLEPRRSDFFTSIYGRNIFLQYAAFYPGMDTILLLCIASPVDGRALRIVNESRAG